MAHTGSGNATWVDYPSTATLITAATLENIEGQTDLIPAMRTTLFGGPTRTKAPMACIYLNTTIASLAGGDGVLWGTANSIDYDTDSMANVGTGTGAPAQITVPVTGRYLISVNLAASTTTTNTTYARIVLNGTNTNSVSSRATTQSIFSAPGFASGEGVRIHNTFTYGLTAGDRLQMIFFFPLVQDLRAGSGFGDTRATNFSAQYISPIS
jgi:hypothetical protein